MLVYEKTDDPRALERGRRLRRRRLDAHLTLHELAKRANVAATWISAVETGMIASPSVDRLTRLCRQLGCSLDDVMSAMHPPGEHDAEVEAICGRLAARYTLEELRRIEELALVAFGSPLD